MLIIQTLTKNNYKRMPMNCGITCRSNKDKITTTTTISKVRETNDK